jgi:putative transposase
MRDFLFRFSRDRHRWLQWLFEARRRFNLLILNYVVTSNHIHLLVLDKEGQSTHHALPSIVRD